jgi:phage shock protein A
MTTQLRSPVYRSFPQLARALAFVAGRDVGDLERTIAVLERDRARAWAAAGSLEAERDHALAEAEKWKGRALTCVWCGTLCASFADLKRHAAWCEQQPAQAMQKENQRLRSIVIRLGGKP